MKNIFKKNQVIITALAIMIVIAGYLSFTNNDKPGDQDTIEATNPDLEGYEEITQSDAMDVAQSTTDITGDTTTEDTTDGTTDGTLTGTEDTTEDENLSTTAAEEDNDETTPVNTESDSELGDTDGEDILEAAADVTDTGDLDLDEGIPGEAVLASTTLDAGFFITNKLEREQMRARNKETYLEIIESPDVAEDLKKDTINRMIELTDIAEKENNTEIYLEARGFDGALVSINEGKVDVIINAESLNDQQVAIIEEVVKTKTGISVDNMSIVPVVVAE